MPHHENPLLRLGQLVELRPFLFLQGQGFLHKNVFPGRQGLLDHGVVELRRTGNGDRLKGRVLQHGLERSLPFRTGIETGELLQGLLAVIADNSQNAQGVEVPDQVLTPVSRTDDGNMDLTCHALSFPYQL